jgi:hypothetical protein
VFFQITEVYLDLSKHLLLHVYGVKSISIKAPVEKHFRLTPGVMAHWYSPFWDPWTSKKLLYRRGALCNHAPGSLNKKILCLNYKVIGGDLVSTYFDTSWYWY